VDKPRNATVGLQEGENWYTKKREEHAEAEVAKNTDIDSADSLICACRTPMPMWYFPANERDQLSEKGSGFGTEMINGDDDTVGSK